MADLTVIVPSRGRPGNAARLSAAFAQTCTDSTRLLVVPVADDPELDEYRDALPDAQLLVAPAGLRRGMTDPLNYAACRVDSYAIGFMGDDNLPASYGWDAIFLRHLRLLGTGMVYGNDQDVGALMPSHVAMTTDIIRALGWMVHPAMMHLDTDLFWKRLGDQLNRITYLPDVVIDHLHPRVGKAADDDVYRSVHNDETRRLDGAASGRLIPAMPLFADVVRLLCRVP